VAEDSALCGRCDDTVAQLDALEGIGA
jgi:hypothetical protein